MTDIKAGAPVRQVGEFANKGDVVNKSTTVEADSKVVKCVRSVKRNATDDQSLVVEWTFDFDGLTQKELLEMAARQAVIDVQAMFRGSKDKAETWARKTFKYPLERERASPKPAFEKVAEQLKAGKMSDAEKAALLALLTGEASEAGDAAGE